jgi:Eukaryotic phosphomannomutase
LSILYQRPLVPENFGGPEPVENITEKIKNLVYNKNKRQLFGGAAPHLPITESRRYQRIMYCSFSGTLTFPRTAIEADFEKFMYDEIKPRATIGIVGGSDLEKMFEQLNGQRILKEFDYIFPENGLVQIENVSKKLTVLECSFDNRLFIFSGKRSGKTIHTRAFGRSYPAEIY